MQHYYKKALGVWNHAGFQRYFSNARWIFLGRIFNMGVSFFVTAYVIRSLGPDTYGILSYAISFAGLSSIIANLGIDQIVSRELVRTPEKKDTIIGTSIVIKLCGACIALIVTTIAVYVSGNNFYTSIFILIIAAGYLFSSFNIVNTYFQAKAAGRYTSIVSFIIVLILASAKAGAIFFSLPLIVFAYIFFAEPVLYACGFIIVYRIYEKTNTVSWKFSYAEARAILKDSWPLLIAGAFIAIYSRIDQIMLKSMIDEKAVGLYDAGVRLAELWYFIPGLITTAVFPALINAQKVDTGLYYRRLSRLYFALGWIGICITTVVFIGAPLIIEVLYGGAYMGTITVLRMYVLATLAVFITSALQQHLINENHTLIVFSSSVVGALSNIGLNLILIPRYGINGAALATCISYSIIPFSIVLFKKTRAHALVMIKSFIIWP